MHRAVLISVPLMRARYGAHAESIFATARAVASSPELCVLSDASDATGLRASLQPAIRKAGDVAVLLLGDPETLPFFALQNPSLDDDAFVPSDNPYGLPGHALDLAHVALAPLPVGRIPDDESMSGAAFIERIRRLTAIPASTRRRHPGYTLSTKSWQKATTAVARRVNLPPPDLAPPRSPRDFASARSPVRAGARHYLFNLHGADGLTEWFGEDPDHQGKLVPAFAPASVGELAGAGKVRGAVVVSQACYGARLEPEKRGSQMTGISLRFLDEGAAAFVGSTTIAYGSTRKVGSSDELVVQLLRAFAAGMPLGAALARARRALVGWAFRRKDHRAHPAPLKTMLQFVLYGDPLHRDPAPDVGRPGAAPPLDDARETVARAALELDRWRATMHDQEPKSIDASPRGWNVKWSLAHPDHAGARAVHHASRLYAREDTGDELRVRHYRDTVEQPGGGTWVEESTGGRREDRC